MPIPGMPPLGWDSGRMSTPGETQAFTRWIGSNSAWTRELLGVSVDGRDLPLLTVGDGEHTIYINFGIHGTERIANEGGLLWVRDIANRLYDGDPELEALLDRITIAVTPTSNPDGKANNTYGNADGIDVSRDGFRLETPERVAINQAIRSVDPLLLIDVHDYRNGDAELWVGSNRGDVHPDIMGLSVDLADEMRAMPVGLGMRPGLEYPIQNRGPIVHESTFRHAVGILIETDTLANTLEQRIVLQHNCLAIALDFFDTNIAEFVSAREASLFRALNAPGPEMTRLDQPEARPDDLSPINLSGYQLSAPIPERYVTAFGIEVVDGFVPVRQPGRGFLPELFDPDNADRPADMPAAVRRMSLPGNPVAAYVRVDGVTREVTGMFHMVDGVKREVSFG